MKQPRQANLAASILVFGLHLDVPLAEAALRGGGIGFIHAQMQPQQIPRALKASMSGEIVAPRELLGHLIGGGNREPAANLNVLSGRQRRSSNWSTRA